MFNPLVDEGASTNGNIGLVMTEAQTAIAVFNDDHANFAAAIKRWRLQAPAYVYVASDGSGPRRPPQQRYLAHTAPTCEPNCSDADMVEYWHGQRSFVADGICQESCRDFGHVQLGYATLVNTAETAYHQGLDLFGGERSRLLAGAELHASLLAQEPAARRQPPPAWLCGGQLRGAGNGSTWSMLWHHFVTREGGDPGAILPNVTALLPLTTPFCWDHMCWEALTHPGPR